MRNAAYARANLNRRAKSYSASGCHTCTSADLNYRRVNSHAAANSYSYPSTHPHPARFRGAHRTRQGVRGTG